MRPWERIESKTLADLSIFTLRQDTLRHPSTGRGYPFYVLSTVDWCNIVALTAAEEVVLVRQPRAAIAAVTVEIPGGMVDPGETPAEAAVRELAEETGYVGRGPAVPIGVVHPNPAIIDNRCHSFLLRDVELRAAPRPEASEQIETFLVPLADVRGLVERGEISHALVVAAFAHLDRYLGRPGGCP